MNSREPWRLKRWQFVAGTTVALIFTLAAVWFTFHMPPTVILVPAVNLTASPPAVRDTISRAIVAVEQETDSGTAWGTLGMILFAHQFELEADQCLAQAAALERKNFRWPYLLGLSQSVSDRRAAADHFRRALQLNEDFAVGHCRLGELLLDLGELVEAQGHLETAVKMQREDARPQAALARCAQLQGQLDDALELAERAVRLAPKQRATHELLATIQQQRGQRDEAIKHLEIAESLPAGPLPWNDPIAAEVLYHRQDAGWLLEQSQSLVGSGQLNEATRMLEEAVQRDSQDPRIVSALGRVLVQARRMDEAQRVLTWAMGEHPDSAEIAFQLGVAHFFDDQFSPAAAAFRQAIRLKPDYALAHFNMGHALEKLGDKSGAAAAFRKAASYRPTYAAAHTNAGRLLLEEGNTSAALDHLRQSVRLMPRDQVALELLDRAQRLSQPEK